MLLSMVIAIGISVCAAAEIDVNEAVVRYMRVLEQERMSLTELKGAIVHSHPDTVARAVEPFRDHPDSDIQYEAMALDYRTALESGDKQAVQRMTTRAVAMLKGPVGRSVAGRLSRLASDQFSEESRTMIREYLEAGFVQLQGVELLLGAAGMKEFMPQLREWINHSRANSEEVLEQFSDAIREELMPHAAVHDALLALARLGEAQALEAVIQEARENPAVGSLRDLAYVRQPEAIDILVEYLFSDESFEYKADDVLSQPHADVVIPLLAKSINDFPSVSRKQLRTHRDETLQRLRDWVRQHHDPD